MTPSQKVIADYILKNPQKFALSSIRQLEEELNTSKSTIVRLAQMLGYQGFQELKKDFLNPIRQSLEPMNRYKSFLLEKSETQNNMLENVGQLAISNIEKTINLVEQEQFKKAIDLLENATYVYTMGLGISSYLADLAAYLLTRVSLKTYALPPVGLSFAEQIINLEAGDVILTFLFPPYSTETIEGARFAQERGIEVIGITDSVTSEIVPYSEAVLAVPVESAIWANSVVSPLVLVYALCSHIGLSRKPETLKTIETIESLRKSQQKKR